MATLFVVELECEDGEGVDSMVVCAEHLNEYLHSEGVCTVQYLRNQSLECSACMEAGNA